jgi:hypothetical protein
MLVHLNLRFGVLSSLSRSVASGLQASALPESFRVTYLYGVEV